MTDSAGRSRETGPANPSLRARRRPGVSALLLSRHHAAIKKLNCKLASFVRIFESPFAPTLNGKLASFFGIVPGVVGGRL